MSLVIIDVFEDEKVKISKPMNFKSILHLCDDLKYFFSSPEFYYDHVAEVAFYVISKNDDEKYKLIVSINKDNKYIFWEMHNNSIEENSDPVDLKKFPLYEKYLLKIEDDYENNLSLLDSLSQGLLSKEEAKPFFTITYNLSAIRNFYNEIYDDLIDWDCFKYTDGLDVHRVKKETGTFKGTSRTIHLKNGFYHKKDGPAIEGGQHLDFSTGKMISFDRWYLEGIEYTKEEFLKMELS